MALIKCPKCGKDVLDDASFCPYCQEKIADGEKSRNQPRTETTKVSGGEMNSYVILSIVSFVVSAICFAYGFFKCFVYVSGEYGTSVNAYVGGDAYNYIINAGYTVAFWVLTLVFVIIGVACLVLNKLNKISEKL